MNSLWESSVKSFLKPSNFDSVNVRTRMHVTRNRDTEVNTDMVRENMLHARRKSGVFLLLISTYFELIFPV